MLASTLIAIEEKRLRKIEHRQTAQSKAMNADDGVLNRLAIAEARVSVLEDQLLIVGGRVAALEAAAR